MKKVNHVEKGSERYVAGKIEPFNQKNEMFKRPFWDSKVQASGNKFYEELVPPRDKPGCRLYDQSLVNASWTLENSFGGSVSGDTKDLYSWKGEDKFSYPRIPQGLKVSVDNPEILSQIVKKAATFFGASLVGFCRIILY